MVDHSEMLDEKHSAAAGDAAAGIGSEGAEEGAYGGASSDADDYGELTQSFQSVRHSTSNAKKMLNADWARKATVAATSMAMLTIALGTVPGLSQLLEYTPELLFSSDSPFLTRSGFLLS